jgi:penicillin-binding protein 2
MIDEVLPFINHQSSIINPIMDQPFDWHRLYADEHPAAAAVDSRRRLRMWLVGFVLVLIVVLGRAVQLEVTQGAAFRQEAARPLVYRQSLPGVRGRILARDGTVLAYDKKVLALAVRYRYLQQPPNEAWLRSMARARLSKSERKDPERMAAETARLRAEHRELCRRLARLCDVPIETWDRRAARVQERVERIARSVNRRRQARFERHRRQRNSKGSSVLDALRSTVEDSPPAWSPVRDELDYHVMVGDVPLAVVAEIRTHPDDYPGVTILERRRRAYPAGSLAAHVLGHLGPLTKEEREADSENYAEDYHTEDRRGRTGLECRYEHVLHGRRGEAVETTDHGGRVLSSRRLREPGVGRDLVLTLDPRLQRAAESLLDEALGRRTLGTMRPSPEPEPSGGAIVVMDVRRGEILAAASAPRFNPNWFAGGHSRELEAVLTDPAHPMLDRVCRMAIPPGSVFKTVSAVALLESTAVDPAIYDPDEPYLCRGYLHRPGELRCAIYRRRGVGHGEVTLTDALAVSCNVYFFHHAEHLGAEHLGPGPLVDWALRLGFGRPTGVDLPGESAGRVPTPESIADLEGHPWRTADTQAMIIGQGSLTATPLQVARLMAAVANGGRLVTPHVVSRLGLPGEPGPRDATRGLESGENMDDPIRIPPPQEIPELRPSTLARIREGLRRVVADPRGTAHGTVHIESIAVSGKTGTAQTGSGQADHAWFAGYVPAEQPKLCLVVVLEHAGGGGEAAGPVAKRLVLQMRKLGML